MPTDRLAPIAPTPATDRSSALRGGRPTGDVDAFAALLGAAAERPVAAERPQPGPVRHDHHEARDEAGGLRPAAPEAPAVPGGEVAGDAPEVAPVAPQADVPAATPVAASTADAAVACLVGPVTAPAAAATARAAAEALAPAPAAPAPAAAEAARAAVPAAVPAAVAPATPAGPLSAVQDADGQPVTPAARTDAVAAPVDGDAIPGPGLTPAAAPSGQSGEAPSRATVTLPPAPEAAAPPTDPSGVPTAPAANGPAPAVAPETAAAPSLAVAGDDAPAPASTAPQSPVPGLSGADGPATPAPAPVVLPHRTESLHRAPQAVATLLHVAADRGITRARLALRPAELGGVEVQLSSTAAGITARLVADSPEAARMLLQAGEELRRSLEARDVTLISLEVATSGQERREAAPGGRPGEQRGDRPASAASADGDGTPADADASSDPVHSVLELPGGLLVDVLA